MVTKIFKGLIGRNIKAYVDDIMVKSLSFKQYLKDLKKVFIVVKKYKMKLNSVKNMLNIKAGKLLSFIVSKNGIEPNPKRLKALIDMSPPKIFKEVQILIGQIIALNKFISKMANRYLLFF